MSEFSRDVQTDMVDLSGLSLDDLQRIGPSSLGHALTRILVRDEDPTDPVSAFMASI